MADAPDDRFVSYRKDLAFTARGPKAVSHPEQMYAGATSFCRRLYARDLDGIDVAVMGIPFDTAVSNRPGCRFGPRAIRQASTQLSWSHAWPSPFDPFERLAVADWGDIDFDFGHPETVPAQIEAAIAAVLAEGCSVLALGGDHFCTYPALKAHAAKHGPLSLVQIDAHCDTSIDDGSRIDHGTMFYHAARDGIVDAGHSIQIGIRTTYTDPSDFVVHDANAVHEGGIDATVARVREVVGDRPVYFTFDIDGLDPAYAPGTGTPVVGGLTTWQGREIIRRLGSAGGKPINLVGMDVVEVAPAYDQAEITALAGATMALALLCLHAEARGVGS
ncbi:MAG: agmatinase [Pseudomonadota bacterium]